MGHLGAVLGGLGAILGLTWAILAHLWRSWAVLAQAWVILAPSWAILARSKAILGRLGAFLALLGCFSGGAGPPKTLIFLRFFKVFGNLTIFPLTSTTCRIWPHFALLLGPLGVILALFWPPWGPSWDHLGAILGHLGPQERAKLGSCWGSVGL